MEPRREVTAVPGRGLEGDRYHAGVGTYSRKMEPAREVTLVETEALDALEREYGYRLAPGASRRNIETRGVPLNHLVGREFRVGAARLRGIRLCEPCSHLAALTDARAHKGLVHRGGLRAQVLEGGAIRVGDALEVVG
ncbi:MAG: MOSC domain-containing protein [Candidatus Eisenbacteria bacterium]|nr:MOSC domain-containing protein [Candidatus Eisenbacteria bacterium]